MNNSSQGSNWKQHLSCSAESGTVEPRDGKHYSSAHFCFLNVTISVTFLLLTLRCREWQWCGDKERRGRRGEQ